VYSVPDENEVYSVVEDEELRGIVKEVFPVEVIRSPRGLVYRPYLYERTPYTDQETGKAIYHILPENLGYFCKGLCAVRDGASYRKVADYIVTHTGGSCSYQQVLNEYTKVEELLPHWKEVRAKVNNFAGDKHFTKTSEPSKLQITKTKSRLKRELREKENELKRIVAQEAVKTGKLPPEALQDVDKYVSDTARLRSPKQVERIEAEEVAETTKKIIFQPNPGPQTEFLAAPEREVLYGGAAGGGKSYALLVDPLRYMSNPNFNGLLLRRRSDELRELIWKSQELYTQVYKAARWSERKSQWTFPSGARLWFTYLDREDDVLRYQGQAFTWIGFDELTQHPTPFAWDYMRSRLRTTDPSLPLCMRATTNPGGPGHGWVKQMFIDPSAPNKAFVPVDLETKEELRFPPGHSKAGEPLFYRKFIPATLKDNPYLYQDGMYEANLLSLPENQRRQLLEGDWTIAEGAAFPEFHIRTHTCEPFDIPSTWRRFRSCDYGYSSFSAVHWFAIDPAFETLYVYRELYVSKNTARELAKKIMTLEAGEEISYGVLDSSTWHTRGHTGPSIAEEMIAEGCRWRPSDRTGGSRVAGKNRLHELLKYDDDAERPGIVIFNDCRQIIADMQVLPSDPKGSDDIDSRYASDHAYDSIRYGIMSRPKSRSVFDFNDALNKTSWKPFDKVFGY
jgi:phage terminase large subunit